MQGAGRPVPPGLVLGRGGGYGDAVAYGPGRVARPSADHAAERAEQSAPQTAQDDPIAAVLQQAERIALEIEGVDVGRGASARLRALDGGGVQAGGVEGVRVVARRQRRGRGHAAAERVAGQGDVRLDGGQSLADAQGLVIVLGGQAQRLLAVVDPVLARLGAAEGDDVAGLAALVADVDAGAELGIGALQQVGRQAQPVQVVRSGHAPAVGRRRGVVVDVGRQRQMRPRGVQVDDIVRTGGGGDGLGLHRRGGRRRPVQSDARIIVEARRCGRGLRLERCRADPVDLHGRLPILCSHPIVARRTALLGSSLEVFPRLGP
ncbi:hypothetical protein D3C73_939840 [compost metagenome]